MQFNQANFNSNYNPNHSNSCDNSNNNVNMVNNSGIESKCNSILQKYFKHNSFRAHQLEIILNTINGGDTLVVMATGSGKSLCYQIPPIYLNKPSIVISPLISLIQNQVDGLLAKGVKAIAITTGSTSTYSDYQDAFENNKYSVIYLTPEGIHSRMNDIKHLNIKYGISCIAIDESHCVSEWGHDFRPHYKMLYKLRDNFPKIPILALTATATTSVQTEIVTLLKLGTAKHKLTRIISSFNRSNLTYTLKEKKSIEKDLCSAVCKREYFVNGSTIIYTLTQKKAQQIAQILMKHGIAASAYHGGMNKYDRIDTQNKWEGGAYQCIVATIAFGMGIDKPDIRYVIHYGMPTSIEAYYQHTGRAGRDGQLSRCILFWSRGDFSNADWRASNSSSSMNQQRIIELTNKMKAFVYSRECRVKYILNYFGEEFRECITRCDNCIETQKLNARNRDKSSKGMKDMNQAKDFTEEARYLVDACYETGQNYGITTLVAMVQGKENKITEKIYNLKNRRSFGKLSSFGKDWITGLSRKLVELGFLGEIWVNFNSKGYNKKFVRGYKKVIVTKNGFKLLSKQCRVPPFVPDADMMKAQKSAAVASSKWKFGNSPAVRSTKARSSTKWSFVGTPTNTNTNNRKRSYSQISDNNHNNNNNNNNNNKLKNDIFSQRAASAMKRRKILSNNMDVEVIKVTPDSVNSLIGLSLKSKNEKPSKPALLENLTGDLLKEKLIAFRKRFATKSGLIAYQIISNDGMDILDKYRPSTVDKLQLIGNKHNGIINDTFIKNYGSLFTKLIRNYCDKNSLSTDIGIGIQDDHKQNEEEKDINMSQTTTISTTTTTTTTEIEEDINAKIIVAPKSESFEEFELSLPEITTQSQQIYESFQFGKNIEDIVIERSIKRATIEKCLSNMIINGYKINWNRLPFTIKQIRSCFNALSVVGISANYDDIRNQDKGLLGNFSDSQIDLLIARYITDNFVKPKSQNHGKRWSVEDDDKLWNERDDCIIDLANRFKRADTSIMARLQSLRNQNSKNHSRLLDHLGHEFGQSTILCNGLHIIPNQINDEYYDKQWNVEEDLCLYNNRDCCMDILTKHFGIKYKMINMRLMDLSGVDLAARARMNQYQNKNIKKDNNDDMEIKMHEEEENNNNNNNNNDNIPPAIDDYDEDFDIYDKTETHKDNYYDMVRELINNSSSNGISFNELVQNLHSTDAQKQLLRILQEMNDSFQIYNKNDKYFAF